MAACGPCASSPEFIFHPSINQLSALSLATTISTRARWCRHRQTLLPESQWHNHKLLQLQRRQNKRSAKKHNPKSPKCPANEEGRSRRKSHHKLRTCLRQSHQPPRLPQVRPSRVCRRPFWKTSSPSTMFCRHSQCLPPRSPSGTPEFSNTCARIMAILGLAWSTSMLDLPTPTK